MRITRSLRQGAPPAAPAAEPEVEHVDDVEEADALEDDGLGHEPPWGGDDDDDDGEGPFELTPIEEQVLREAEAAQLRGVQVTLEEIFAEVKRRSR